MDFCLNDNIPNFKIGTVIYAYITAKRLPQIYGPEGLGEDEEGREAEGIGRVGEKETGAVGEIGREVGGRFG